MLVYACLIVGESTHSKSFFISGHSTGDKQDTNNPLCRQGLQVPKEPWLYSCAEPMLGRFVCIRLEGKGKLKLCEVGIYVNGRCCGILPSLGGFYF